MPESLTSAPVEPAQNDEQRAKRTFRRGLAFFFILFLIGGAYWAGFKHGKTAQTQTAAEQSPLPPDQAIILNKDAQDKTIDFSLFWKVWGLLKDKYVDRAHLDAHALFYGAIKGMLAATGDPYTTFFDPEENKQFNQDMTGTFEGIGAEIGVKDQVLTIIAPLDETPAQKAGLKAGDKVLKINGETTSNMTSEDAALKIRGQKGTEVTLTIFRSGEQETRDIVVKRDVITVKSVRFEMKGDNIAYIRVSRFGDDTTDGFRVAARQARDKSAKGLIIDLRSNPGGYLKDAVDVASMLLPSGKTVVIEEDGNGKRTELKSHAGDILSDMKTVVLMDEGSASASEILAGALRDNRDNVTLVGKKSFGKGSVQELIPVSSDTSVKITVQRWLTPSGKQINQVGIPPDVDVTLSSDDYNHDRDPQLDKALEILK